MLIMLIYLFKNFNRNKNNKIHIYQSKYLELLTKKHLGLIMTFTKTKASIFSSKCDHCGWGNLYSDINSFLLSLPMKIFLNN